LIIAAASLGGIRPKISFWLTMPDRETAFQSRAKPMIDRPGRAPFAIDLNHLPWTDITVIMTGCEKNLCYDGSYAMNVKTAALLLSGLLAACAQTQLQEAAAPPAPSPPPASEPAPAQPAEAAPSSPEAAAPVPVNRIVEIRRAGCQNLLTLPPDDRAAASMFYIGYQAARFRSRTISVGGIPSIEAQALTYCQEHPDQTVAQAFAQAYSRARR
jgi:hypothetical protein